MIKINKDLIKLVIKNNKIKVIDYCSKLDFIQKKSIKKYSVVDGQNFYLWTCKNCGTKTYDKTGFDVLKCPHCSNVLENINSTILYILLGIADNSLIISKIGFTQKENKYVPHILDNYLLTPTRNITQIILTSTNIKLKSISDKKIKALSNIICPEEYKSQLEKYFKIINTVFKTDISKIEDIIPLCKKEISQTEKEKNKYLFDIYTKINSQTINNNEAFVIANDLKEEKFFSIYCPKKKNFEIKKNINIKDDICPICGEVHNFNFNKVINDKSICKNTTDYFICKNIKNNLVCQYFSITRIFEYKNKHFFYNEEESEKETYIITSANIFKYNKLKNIFEISNLNYVRPETQKQSEEELINIINNTFLASSGIIEYSKDTSIAYNLDYIKTYLKCPQIELFAKSGLTAMTKTIINHQVNWSMFDLSKTNILGILNIKKNQYQFLKDNNIDFFHFTFCKNYWDLEPNIDKNNLLQLIGLRQICGSFILPFDLLEIFKMKLFSSKQILTYIEKCYQHQCIYPETTIQIWKDYLNLAKKLNYDLTIKELKFPSSLKKEHDIATFAYNALNIKIAAEKFSSKALHSKKYEFETDDLVVIVPQTPADIISEGKFQRHCVATYIEKMSDGLCTICFIRKKTSIEIPYYTVEISPDNKIVQVKGFANCNATLDVLNFIEKWAKNKNLEINFSNF